MLAFLKGCKNKGKEQCSLCGDCGSDESIYRPALHTAVSRPSCRPLAAPAPLPQTRVRTNPAVSGPSEPPAPWSGLERDGSAHRPSLEGAEAGRLLPSSGHHPVRLSCTVCESGRLSGNPLKLEVPPSQGYAPGAGVGLSPPGQLPLFSVEPSRPLARPPS